MSGSFLYSYIFFFGYFLVFNCHSSSPLFLQEVPLPYISQSKKEGSFKPLSEKKAKKIRPRRFNSSEPYALIL
jgi:hypothetical protein